MSRTYLVAGNWKMHGSLAMTAELIAGIRDGLAAAQKVEALVCPPYPYLAAAAQAIGGSPLALGAQNLADQDKQGAYTGEVLGSMLVELGCRYVIVGHSERRAYYGETDAIVARKTGVAQGLGLVPIVCVGETLAEREAGETEAVIGRQEGFLANFLLVGSTVIFTIDITLKAEAQQRLQLANLDQVLRVNTVQLIERRRLGSHGKEILAHIF